MDTQSHSSSDLVSLGNEFSTKLVFFSHEFPCDDLQELFRSLQRHSREKGLPLVATFLAECTNVLKDEARKLPQSLRDLLPPFQTVMALAAGFGELRKGPLGGAWEGALLCILEIGMLIG
jgi:Starter unit:ACP transacylase in aflatoxin biosynthesis